MRVAKRLEAKKSKEINITQEENTYADKFDVYKDIVKVHSKDVISQVSEDITLAKFTEVKDKVYIVEMADCGRQCKEVIRKIKRNFVMYKKEHKRGMIEDLTQEEQKELEEIENDIYKDFMSKITMLCLVNRNVENNYIVKNLTGRDEIEMETEQTSGMKEIGNKAKESLKNEELRQ